MRATTFFLTALLLAAPPAAARDVAAGGEGGHPLRSLSDLRRVEESILRAAEKALPAVVFIDGGSGVIISPEGHVLTNDHVIAGFVRRPGRRGEGGGTLEMSIQFTGGRRQRATLLGRDPGGDIALLQLNEPGPYPFLELGESDRVRPGQWVLAVGNPFLLGESPFAFFSGPGDYSPSVSLGIVSAVHRSSPMYPDAIQVDTAVNPGSSGGPLLTLDGKVVGINGKIQTRFLIEVNSGVGYAVPSNQIARFLEPLKKANGGIVRRGTLVGLLAADRGDAERGLEIQRVAPGSPSAQDGIRAGDRILSVDGQPIWSRRRLDGLLATYPAGSKLSVRLERNGTFIHTTATLDPEAPGWLGVMAEAAEGPRKGARIREPVKGSPAERGGLLPGDVVLKVDDAVIENVADLGDAIQKRLAGDTVQILVLRGQKEEKLTIRLSARPEE